MWNIMKYIPRPRLQTMDTGNVYASRPYGPAVTSIFGDGGHPVQRCLNLVSPGVFEAGQGVTPVSVGGSTNFVYEGARLNSLRAPASSSASI